MAVSSNFRYDKETHTYYLGDTVIPHPTLVLEQYSQINAVREVNGRPEYIIPRDILKSAKLFGLSVHEYLAAYNNGTLDMADLPISEGQYDMSAIVRNYETEIYKKLNLKPHTVEIPLLHAELRYGCIADFLSNPTTFDYKPMSRLNDWLVGVQLAANAGAAINNGLIDPKNPKTCSLHYDPFGKWKIKYWDFADDWRTWKMMLYIHNKGGFKNEK